jgi:hypothetical protein
LTTAGGGDFPIGAFTGGIFPAGIFPAGFLAGGILPTGVLPAISLAGINLAGITLGRITLAGAIFPTPGLPITNLGADFTGGFTAAGDLIFSGFAFSGSLTVLAGARLLDDLPTKDPRPYVIIPRLPIPNPKFVNNTVSRGPLSS